MLKPARREPDLHASSMTSAFRTLGLGKVRQRLNRGRCFDLIAERLCPRRACTLAHINPASWQTPWLRERSPSAHGRLGSMGVHRAQVRCRGI